MPDQGEPEFERLKRELEEVKNAPRGLEGTFRTAAEMERHRAQLADAAIEEQLEVQTAFREHGARLQAIYDKRQRTDVEVARRDQEMKQLQGAPAARTFLTVLKRSSGHTLCDLCGCSVGKRILVNSCQSDLHEPARLPQRVCPL